MNYCFLVNSNKSISFPKGKLSSLILPSSGPFSNFKTPLGHTAEQTPHPTQEARTIFCPFCA